MLFMLEVTDESLAHAMAALPELGELPPARFCAEEVHDHLRRHPEEMTRVMDWPDAALRIGNCKVCGATLAVEMP